MNIKDALKPREEYFEMVQIEKVGEAPDPVHPGNIPVGYKYNSPIFIGSLVEPEVGKSFIAGMFVTSIVTKIIDKETFRTLNSIYKWRILSPSEAPEGEVTS